MSKIYSIVTNDELELPIKCDIVGIKAAAKELNISASYLMQLMCGAKPWPSKSRYKAVCVGNADLFKKNKNLYHKRYAMLHDRTEYFKAYHQKKKGGKNNVNQNQQSCT